VARLGGAIGWMKVGARLFTAAGPDVVRELKRSGFKVFLDLKFHDIPATAAAACANAARTGADIINVHALGGAAMMEAGAKAAREAARVAGYPAPMVIAVTLLTSMGPDGLAALGISKPVDAMALHLAGLAKKAGLDGVVASGHDAAAIKNAFGVGFITVTPGVRPAWAAVDDQKRIMTPAEALKAGADYLVVGRPIFASADPKSAAMRTLEEMELR